jgi:hypothetical protein
VFAVQTFFFDMKDGVPLRDRIGIEFDTNLEAIEHRHVLAQRFRDDSLTNDQDLEISVVTHWAGKSIGSSCTATKLIRRAQNSRLDRRA